MVQTVYKDVYDSSRASNTIVWGSGGSTVQSNGYTSTRSYRKGDKRPKPMNGLDPTAYSMIERHTTAPKGEWHNHAASYPPATGTTQTGVPFFPSDMLYQQGKLLTGTWDANLEDIANLKAMAKLNRRDMDLGTAWAERGKTAALVAGVATTAVNALRAIKRGDGRGLLNELGLDHSGARARGVVDASLAYHYGMKPLLQDVAGATSLLARNTHEDRWAVRVRGAEMRDKAVNLPGTFMSEFPYTVQGRQKKGAHVLISAVPRRIDRAQDLMWATGLDNPLGTAWEVTPYSFVADWIFPVGEWLSALNSFKYYSQFVTVSSQKLESHVTYTGESGKFGGSVFTPRNLTKGVDSLSWLERRVYTGVPLLGLPIKNPVSVDHMSKALNLLTSLSARDSSSGFRKMIRY